MLEICETMSVANQTKLTPQDLLTMPNGNQYELVDGELKEQHVSLLSSWVGGELYFRVRDFCRAHDTGEAWPADVGCQCFPDMPLTVRRPDAMFICRERVPADWIEAGYLRIAPDLVAEVISPNDLAADLETKVAEYLSAGIQLVWIVDPEHRTVRIHRADGTVGWLREDNTLNGENVLPGFSCPVRDLFPAASRK
jgi:Uma2 family endonuclease